VAVADDAIAQAAAAAATVTANAAGAGDAAAAVSNNSGGTFGFLADAFETFLEVGVRWQWVCVRRRRRVAGVEA
jgi:hypothetical protein